MSILSHHSAVELSLLVPVSFLSKERCEELKMLLRSAQCPFLLLFSPRTSCLAHCPGGLELQCSCFAGRNLKHSNIMYINVRAIRIKGCWYCCVVSGVFLGLARLPSSACLPGELCLLVLPSPQCLFPPELVLLE